MHGVKREKKTPASIQARQARKEKEHQKIHAYLDIEQRFFQLRDQGIKTKDALAHTTHLLTLNPELYTAWNYRRDILLALFQAPLDEQPQQKPDVFASLRQPTDAPPSTESPTASSSAPDPNPNLAPTAPTPGTSAAPAATDEDQDKQRKQQRTRLLVERDLELTEHALRAHPKVYWIWNHRMWCLENLPEDPDLLARGFNKWKIEMKLVDKMLELDPRNFHGWTYRRYLTAQLAATFLPSAAVTASPPPVADVESFPASLSRSDLPAEARQAQLELAQSELQYTLRKIEANISNFSAWHQRTKLLPPIWDAKGWDEDQRRKARDQEYELVKQAMYTDPADQSVWIYHRWLVEQDPAASILVREIEAIEELLDLEPDSKWCMHTLAHYKTLLIDARKKAQDDEAASASAAQVDDEEKRLRDQVKQLLEKLIDVDPDRANRYRDLLEGRAHF
ncbi:uncharacterized protein PFL1_03136 [Pseudozyma flocculosa PF-1]|uniref:Geranylgeranyl transferase type-2 subunit alpha n=2 Tax=Pseudozyma flocculosa TaxID=84751 RepID=A0A5C3F3Q1_9BASI|nr:uncharacterized protein PFL1_03136 [Pseudozyma flocculosa PF-1]EPQ29381.1 hypothetical protein PFL1_03136 [Pseudozyma flocculosa PF-1]SPO37901.1 related to Rab geranylgeranyltransferase alpha subunit [Pseudozyma flocculosa]